MLTAGAGLAIAACASGQAQPQFQASRPRPPTVPADVRPLPTGLHQQQSAGLRFARRNGPNPAAVTMLASSRNLRPGQQATVLTVRGIGNLTGSCRDGTPDVKFRLTYRGAGPPQVTQIRDPLTRPVALRLLAPYWPPAPTPAAGRQHLAFVQITGGGESADFSLVVWATLTPVAGGCAFTTNGLLRVRGSDFLKRLG